MEFNLLTFASSKYDKTLKRINNEAHNMKIFNDIFAWNEHDIDVDFFNKHSDFMKNSNRGFGYWIWKPQIILQALKKIPRGSILIYCDAGCSLNVEGVSRLREYGNMVINHPAHILCFQQSDSIECSWTKMDLMNYLNYNKPEEMTTKQMVGGIIVIHNVDDIEKFFKNWLDICCADNYRYIDNSESKTPNSQSFCDHRHDQSIFSILCKQNKCLIIPDETYWENAWDRYKHYPIHATRLKY